MKSTHRTCAGLAALGIGVVAAVGFLGGGRSGPAGSLEQKSKQGARSSDQAPTFTASGFFAEGVEQEYDVSDDATVSVAQGKALTTLALHGKLRFTALTTAPTVRVRGAFKGTATALAGGAPAATDGSLTAAAQLPFVLEFGTDGRFLRVLGTSEDVLPMIGRAWTSLGESLQMTRPRGGARWQARESDAAGDFIAEYEQRDVRDVLKRKAKYDSFASDAVNGYDIVRSREAYSVDEEARLDALDLDEELRVNVENMPGFAGTSKLSLRKVGERVPSEELSAWLADARAAKPLASALHDQQEKALDRARIGDLTVGDAFGRLQGFTKKEPTKAERDRAGRAFVALTAMLRQEPSTIGKVRAHLEKAGPDTNVMLAALRDSSTPAAQRLLAEMTAPSSPLDATQRLEAARSLSRVDKPDANTVASLKKLQADPLVGTQATYGLGSALHRLKDEEPAVAEDVRSTLVNQLDAAPGAGRISALTALGNAGDVATLDDIERYVSDPSPDVRAAAAQALRRIAGSEADGLLAALARDPIESVRYSACDAIGERTPSRILADALVPLALGETDFRVRSSAVNVLGRWIEALPELSPTLERVAVQDPHADLRNIAKNALDILARAQKAVASKAAHS